MAERDPELEQLLRDLAELDGDRKLVAEELRSAAELVESRRTLPALPRLERAKAAFDVLLARTREALGKVGAEEEAGQLAVLAPSEAEGGRTRCLADLSNACEELSRRKEAHTRRLQRAAVALALLGRFEQLRARSEDGRALLGDLVQRAGALIDELQGPSASQHADELVQGRHPLVLFLDLVEESQRSLDGERLSKLEDQVEKTLGARYRRLASKVDVLGAPAEAGEQAQCDAKAVDCSKAVTESRVAEAGQSLAAAPSPEAPCSEARDSEAGPLSLGSPGAGERSRPVDLPDEAGSTAAPREGATVDDQPQHVSLGIASDTAPVSAPAPLFVPPARPLDEPRSPAGSLEAAASDAHPREVVPDAADEPAVESLAPEPTGVADPTGDELVAPPERADRADEPLKGADEPPKVEAAPVLATAAPAEPPVGDPVFDVN